MDDMLTQTFLFLPGVQERTERHLWYHSINRWDDLLAAPHIPGVSKERLVFWKTRIRHAQQLMDQPDGIYAMTRLLGTRFVWRAANQLLDNPRFLDIETTEFCNQITVVGISDGDFYQAFVAGVNLDTYHLRRALAGATCLITFNGASFDLPMIERTFPGVLPQVPHIDLRHVCAQAGLRGGLKRIEQHLRIMRAAAIRDKDGTDAVLLWHAHCQGDAEALRDLVDYNAADVLNLQPLLTQVLPALWRSARHQYPLPFTPLATPL